jgi:hypothetical protein
LATAVVVLGAPVAANATVIDFTGNDFVFSSSSAVATFSGGQTLTVTPVPTDRPLTLTQYDGPTPNPANTAGLDLIYDGLGIGPQDDEARAPLEFFELEFNVDTQVTGIYVLDLFFGSGSNMSSFESVLVWFGGRTGAGDAPDLELMASSPTFLNGGLAFLAFDFFGTRLTLGPGSGNEVGNPDFALAGVQVVPLPASALLLLGGLGGIAALKRRKKA